jgi:hypothetical protein
MSYSPPSVRIIVGCSIRAVALLLAESAGLCHSQYSSHYNFCLAALKYRYRPFALEDYGRLSFANGKTASSTPNKKELGSYHFLPRHSHIKWCDFILFPSVLHK